MKVLFVINSSNNGGAIKMIVTLYNEIKKVFPSSKIVFLKKIVSQYSNIEEAEYLTSHLKSPYDYFCVYKRLRTLIYDEKPDVLISFLPLSNILTSIIGKKLGVKVRIVSQRNPPQIYGFIVRQLDKYLGANGFYTANVCNSLAGMQSFNSYPNSYKNLLSVINNCVEPADLTVSIKTAKEILNIVSDKVVLTCVGRLHDQKNHQILIRSMKNIDNAVLYLAGDGPLRDDIIALIAKESVTDKVVLLGDLNRDEVRLLLRASDIFVIPSKYEGLSNSLIEAMSYGLPIVFSNIPSFTTFMELDDSTGFAGVFVKECNVEMWSEALNGLINDKELIKHYSNCSFEHVRSLTSERMASQFIDLFNEKE